MSDWNGKAGRLATVFSREFYSIGEAARLMRVPQATLRVWLEGRGRLNPVIRSEPTGNTNVTWAEFAEGWLLREYRLRNVPLQKIRPFISELRTALGVAHPLAEFRPLVDKGSRELVLDVQDRFPDSPEVYLVRQFGRTGQIGGPTGPAWQAGWSDVTLDYLDRVEFEGPYAARVKPLGSHMPVVMIDPSVAFGIPQVHGIRTETLAETYAELRDFERVAREWEIPVADVRAALLWEDFSKAA